MKLLLLTENQLAKAVEIILTRDRKLADLLHIDKPQVDGDQITIRIGPSTPEMISIIKYGPQDIKVALSQRLARLLGMRQHYTMAASRDVVRKIDEIMSNIASKINYE